MLDGTADTASHIEVRADGLTRLTHLTLVRHHAVVDHGTARRNLSAKHIGQSLQLVEAFLVVDATTARDQDLGIGDVDHGFVFLDGLNEFHLKLAGVELRGKSSDHALTAFLALTLLHHARTHGRHLRTGVRANDGGHQVAAESRTCHAELRLTVALLVADDFELGAVCGQTSLQARSDTRSHVTANGGGTIEHDVGATLLDNLVDDLRVLLTQVVFQFGAVGDDDFVSTEFNQFLGLVFHIVTQQHGNDFLTKGIGEVAGLS